MSAFQKRISRNIFEHVKKFLNRTCQEVMVVMLFYFNVKAHVTKKARYARYQIFLGISEIVQNLDLNIVINVIKKYIHPPFRVGSYPRFRHTSERLKHDFWRILLIIF